MGLDSLDVIEVLMAIEDEFGVEIPDEVSDKMLTPGDAVLFIHKTFENLADQEIPDE